MGVAMSWKAMKEEFIMSSGRLFHLLHRLLCWCSRPFLTSFFPSFLPSLFHSASFSLSLSLSRCSLTLAVTLFTLRSFHGLLTRCSDELRGVTTSPGPRKPYKLAAGLWMRTVWTLVTMAWSPQAVSVILGTGMQHTPEPERAKIRVKSESSALCSKAAGSAAER